MWKGLYLSLPDIYLRRGTSTNIILSQMRIQREEFHIFALTKSSIFPFVPCCSSTVWIFWNPVQAASPCIQQDRWNCLFHCAKPRATLWSIAQYRAKQINANAPAQAVIMADMRVMPYAGCLTVTCINETNYSTYHKALNQRCVEGSGQVGFDWKHWARTAGSWQSSVAKIDAAARDFGLYPWL